MIAALIALGAVGVVVFAAAQWSRRRARREGLLLAATRMGLEYSRTDPFGLVDLPFDLFARGDGRGVENLVWGDYRGDDVKFFDYWYYVESRSGQHRSRTYHRFTCGLGRLPIDAAHTTIAPRTFANRIADAVRSDDVAFESDEFNRSFSVRSADRRFSYALIDPRMMNWLMSTAAAYRFELIGPLVLVTARPLEPDDLAKLAWWLHGFREHVPAVAASLYPQATPEVEGWRA